MEVDDGSDLTSLEDEEYQLDGAATRKDKNVPHDLDPSLISEDEGEQRDDGVKLENDTGNIAQLSPSRVGSSLTRPAPVAGLRTYSRKREHSGRSFKQERPPKRRPSPEKTCSESPLSLIPSPSPSPRKRRVPSTANQKPPSTPSKHAKKGKSLPVDLTLDDEKTSVPNGKRKSTSDRVSRRPRTSPMTKPEANGRILSANKEPEPSAPAGRRKRGRPPKNKEPLGPESLDSIGNLAWVRVNRENGVVDDDTVESFWWPAAIEHSGSKQKTIHARLFFPPSGTESPTRAIVNNPSSSNIVSYKDQSYTTNSFRFFRSSSARSQPTGFDELRSQWERACKEIMKEDLRLHDGFPTSLTALLSQPLQADDDDIQYGSVSRQASPEQSVASSPTIRDDGEPWSPPPPEPNIAIPGEFVLSTTKTKGFLGKFYPAKVIAYVPPSRSTVPARYTVHFMDNFHEDVTRDMFYVYEQDGFGTCKLGQFESLESLEEKDDEDDPNDGLSQNNGDPVTLKDPPLLPAPSPERFCELSMVEQTSYIIPILTKVVANKYKPAEGRITAFLNGGRQRAKMSKEAIAKGLLTRSELSEFARIIRSWALHVVSLDNEIQRVNDSHHPAAPDVKDQPSRSSEVDALQEEALSPVNSPVKEAHEASAYDQPPTLPPPSLPPSSTDGTLASSPNVIDAGDHDAVLAADEQRTVFDDRSTQNGTRSVTAQSTSRSFHNLLNHEKIQFCTDVLLKEGIIQLLLWRAGKRHAPDLLSDTEELLLHESGSNLAGEFDIARTVRDLRMKKEKSLQGRGISSPQTTSAGGTRSRPRKV